MIKSLQKRFILTAMIAVIIVIGIMMVVINSANYAQIVKNADNMLSVLAENGGFFPKPGEKGFLGANKGPGHGLSAEAPYETRFFSVSLSSGGKVISVNTGSIAAVATDEAAGLASEIYESGREKGFSGVYRYSVTDTEEGLLVLFLDRSRELDSFKSFLSISLAVAIFTAAGIFIFVLLLSKRAIRPIAQSYARQKQFITDAGHELKTPLSVINANTEVLELTQGENKWTKSIKNQVRRLSELTDSLVSLARMDEENSRLVMTEFSLSDAVEECLEPFEELARQNGRELSSDIQPGVSYNGNEESIRKLLGILLDNAVKYSDENGKILVSMKAAGRGAVLEVKNTVGNIIEKGGHDEMFERFYRADSSRGDKKGYGIGLSVAKAVCQAHRGKINAKSEDGRSLTVTVSF